MVACDRRNKAEGRTVLVMSETSMKSGASLCRNGQGGDMNKSVYRVMLDLAGGDLMQRILSELSETKKLRDCPSYAELSDFCKALNLVALWSGMPKVTPKKLV